MTKRPNRARVNARHALLMAHANATNAVNHLLGLSEDRFRTAGGLADGEPSTHDLQRLTERLKRVADIAAA